MKREGLTKAYRAFAMFGSFGFIMAASILVGYFIGSYLDKQFDTEPWFLIIFLFLAIIGAFIELFKTFQRFMAINAKDKGKKEDLR
ncbi:MAG: AtpZ/AtpI family protein [Thermodesulfobacteriota bacterium]